jgi:hypothetical protein
MSEVCYALSIRQPWAGLIVAGVKTIEIRTWPTRRRGRIAIHASKIVDARPPGWSVVRPEFAALCELRGGIIGMANLIDCIEYPTAAAFAHDAGEHCNALDWFQPPRMYGFRLADTERLPFQRYSGNTGFFHVQLGSSS